MNDQSQEQNSEAANQSQSAAHAAEQNEASERDPAAEKRRNMIIIAVVLGIIGLVWYNNSKAAPQQGPGGQQGPAGPQEPVGPGGPGGPGGTQGPDGPGEMQQYLVGTWQAQTQAGVGETDMYANGTFVERMQYAGYDMIIGSSGTWSVNGNRLTMRIVQSDLPQRRGSSETVELQPIGRNECQVLGAQVGFVMYRVR